MAGAGKYTPTRRHSQKHKGGSGRMRVMAATSRASQRGKKR